MKRSILNRISFFLTSLGFGLAAQLLLAGALETGYDHKGLFVWTTPSFLMMLAVCAVYALVLIVLTRTRIVGDGSYEQVFPRGWFRGSLMTLGGAMLALDHCYALDPEPMYLMVLGFAAAACMVMCGVHVILGLRPHPVFHGTVCVYAVADLLMYYRSWGASAHLEQYAMSLLAGLLLMLYSFHRCAADAGVIRRRKLVLTGFGAVLCSLAAIADPGDKVYYLAIVIWILGSMCLVDPVESEEK